MEIPFENNFGYNGLRTGRLWGWFEWTYAGFEAYCLAGKMHSCYDTHCIQYTE